MKLLYSRNFSGIATLVICIIIFCFSAQNGEQSSAVASNILIRKIGHFSEYATLGFFVYCFFNNFLFFKKSEIFHKLSCLIFVIFYASTDEFHQLFVPGRSGNILDIIIDSFGGLFGIILSYFILKLISK